MDFNERYYLLTGGEILDRAIAYREAIVARKREIADVLKSIGAEQYWLNDTSMKVNAVSFSGSVPEGFTKPKKDGRSWPKKGNKESYVEIFQPDGIVEMFPPLSEFIEWLGCPTHYSYTRDHGTATGCTCIGHTFKPIGMYWYSTDSPIMLKIPNVEYYQREAEADGRVIVDDVLSWRMTHEGAEAILLEKWTWMVAEHEAIAKAGGE